MAPPPLACAGDAARPLPLPRACAPVPGSGSDGPRLAWSEAAALPVAPRVLRERAPLPAGEPRLRRRHASAARRGAHARRGGGGPRPPSVPISGGDRRLLRAGAVPVRDERRQGERPPVRVPGHRFGRAHGRGALDVELRRAARAPAFARRRRPLVRGAPHAARLRPARSLPAGRRRGGAPLAPARARRHRERRCSTRSATCAGCSITTYSSTAWRGRARGRSGRARRRVRGLEVAGFGRIHAGYRPAEDKSWAGADRSSSATLAPDPGTMRSGQAQWARRIAP
jgi:hypothetical protein